MSFKVNDRVVHCREGLSTIVGETNIAGNEYFIVASDKGDHRENIYVLKTRTENIIRSVMSKEDAQKVIDFMKEVKPGFISNTKQRRDLYKKKLLSGNVYDLAFLAVQLYFFNYLNANGQVVKLGPTDLQMLKDAEAILFDELSISFEIPRQEMSDRISSFFK